MLKQKVKLHQLMKKQQEVLLQDADYIINRIADF